MRINLEDLCRIAEIQRFGGWDYAVPINWLMEDPENRRNCVWFYPRHDSAGPGRKPGALFGRPLKYSTIARIARRKTRDAETMLGIHEFLHPGETLPVATARPLVKLLVRKAREGFPGFSKAKARIFILQCYESLAEAMKRPEIHEFPAPDQSPETVPVRRAVAA